MRIVRLWLWLAAVPLVLGALALLAGRYWRTGPDEWFARADAAFRSGDLNAADHFLRVLERRRAPNPLDRLLRAEVATGLGRHSVAIDELAAIPDDTALAPLARLKAGEVELERGQARRAEAAFLSSIRLLPKSVPPRKQLVVLYSIQRRQAELDSQLTQLLELDAVNFTYALHWAKTRNGIWNPRADIPMLEKFVAADPGDRESRLALVEAYRRFDRLDDALRLIKALATTDADAMAAHVSIRMGMGDFDGAKALLAKGPRDSAALARLRGQLAIQRKQADEAARQFRIALESDPSDRMAQSGLGTALLLTGQAKAAEPYLEAARGHDAIFALVSRAATAEGERDRGLPHEMGMACVAAGRTAEARAWLRLAIQNDPLDAEVQRVLYELERGAKTKAVTKEGEPSVGGGPRGSALGTGARWGVLGALRTDGTGGGLWRVGVFEVAFGRVTGRVTT